jgi:peptidoglycan/xylan/chitin deacetylase (PgdA/CDA1 family)
MTAGSAGPDTIALMYHAVTDGPSPGADPHYTVTPRRFSEQLGACVRGGGAVVSGRDWLAGKAGVVLTFDDGHVSNHRVAFPALAAANGSADFFVNPAQVGTTGFATWAELREMSDGGMSIQSHGLDHGHYLTSLSPAALRDELRRARLEIEEHVGRPVTLLAPAGGRAPRDLAAVAREVGYSHVFGSRPGTLRLRSDGALCRFAVTAQLDDGTLASWLAGGRARFVAEARYAVLDGAKRLLGDQLYENIRRRLLGTAAS